MSQFNSINMFDLLKKRMTVKLFGYCPYRNTKIAIKMGWGQKGENLEYGYFFYFKSKNYTK